MFAAAMLYFTGMVVATLACAYASPRWLRDEESDGRSEPSAVLVAGLLWPLLLIGATQLLIAMALYKVEVRRALFLA